MTPEIAQTAKRHKNFLIAAGMAATLGWATYNGTQSFDELLGKRREAQELQEQNAILQRENEQRKQRIERLSGNSSEQDMELRKLNLAKPGEMMFMLPDANKTPGKDAAPDNTGTEKPAPADH